MEPSRKLILALAAVCFAGALSFAIGKKDSWLSPEGEVTRTISGKPGGKRTSYERSDGARNPTVDEVVRMAAADWETVFKTRHLDLDAEFRQEILIMAGELQQMIENGASPRDEEPQAYAETILVLLNEKRLPQE